MGQGSVRMRVKGEGEVSKKQVWKQRSGETWYVSWRGQVPGNQLTAGQAAKLDDAAGRCRPLRPTNWMMAPSNPCLVLEGQVSSRQTEGIEHRAESDPTPGLLLSGGSLQRLESRLQ